MDYCWIIVDMVLQNLSEQEYDRWGLTSTTFTENNWSINSDVHGTIFDIIISESNY